MDAIKSALPASSSTKCRLTFGGFPVFSKIYPYQNQIKKGVL